MLYVFMGLLFVIGVMVGLFIERGRLNRNVPSIGRLELNFTPGAEDPLKLHITDDIDMDRPPKEVRLYFFVKGDT